MQSVCLADDGREVIPSVKLSQPPAMACECFCLLFLVLKCPAVYILASASSFGERGSKGNFLAF